MENKYFFLSSVILGALILFGAWYFQVFTDLEVPSRLLAAILGVVITAIITQLLLSGQTNKEVAIKQEQQKWQADQDKIKQEHQEKLAKETREWQENQTRQTKEWQELQDRKTEQWRIEHDRNNTVFCEKIKIYKQFLDTLYNSVKNEELTASGKLELQYQTSLVAMHCEPENILKLSNAVKQVVTVVCKPNRHRSPNDNDLLRTLFDVVEALRKDLYANDDVKTFSDDVRGRTITNFNSAYRLVDAEETQIVNETKVQNWEQTIKKWQDDGWMVKSLESEDCPLQITSKDDGNPGMIDMGFYDNHYYIQARYEGDWNFSKCLKWDNGGRRQREMWWEYPPLAIDIQKGGFIDKFKSSPDLQQYIIKKVEYLMGVIQKEYHTVQWMQAVGEHENWKLFTWYWSTLACESQNEEEGKVYMDTMPSEEDKTKAVVQLGNRANNVELLKQTLTRIGCSEKIKNIDAEDCYVTLETIASIEPKDVGERLRYWIGKLSEK